MVALKSSGNGFSEIETDRAAHDIARVQEAFHNSISAVHTKSADWANWDDTYNFISDPDPAYVASNLSVESLRGIKVDLIMVISPSGKRLVSEAVPNALGETISSQSVLDRLTKAGQLHNDVSLSGFLMIDRQPVILSVRPVRPTGLDQPGRGWIVFGRRIDGKVQLELQRLTHQPVHIRLARASEQRDSTGGQFVRVQTVSKSEIHGTCIVNDMLGQPQLAIDTYFNRTVSAYGDLVGQRTVAQVLGIAGLLVIVMMAIIERFVLGRLRLLHQQVAAIGGQVEGQRVKLGGRDELTSLANQVNTMLDRIESGSMELRASREELKAQKENLEEIVRQRTAEIEKTAEALRASEEQLRSQNENLELVVANRTREIEHQALHDKLTGLPNRNLFLDRLGHALTVAQRTMSTTAVLFVDLDNFKLINDSLGHDQGDQLLIEVGKRLSASVREGDLVARLGGDEFTVLLKGAKGESGVIEVAERILGALALPVHLGSSEVFTGASIGVAICPSGEFRPNEMLKHADVAMYRAKASGKSSYVVFDAAMNDHVVERMELEMALRRAIDKQQLEVAFQPIVDLTTGAVTGVEALARWNHPERGPISPADFIPIAEDTGLIAPLGTWVLGTACAEAAKWNQLRPVTLNVNVSGRQLKRSDIVDVVADALRQSGLPPAQLKLEITESILLDDAEGVARKLDALKGLGVKLALDDFGTGYSSLSTLRQFPIDTLKVDRSFIHLLENEPDAKGIVQAIAALAQTLSLDVTAEGVETQAQAIMLRGFNVSHAQGYLFGRPMSASELEEHFLRPLASAA